MNIFAGFGESRNAVADNGRDLRHGRPKRPPPPGNPPLQAPPNHRRRRAVRKRLDVPRLHPMHPPKADPDLIRRPRNGPHKRSGNRNHPLGDGRAATDVHEATRAPVEHHGHAEGPGRDD